MTAYEPTPTKRIKQSLSEELLKFITRMTSTKRDTKRLMILQKLLITQCTQDLSLCFRSYIQ